MAYPSKLKGAIWLAFFSIGLISTVLLLKLAIPPFLSFAVSVLPRVWISFCILFSPPYLYIVVNFIIISIAASSSYHNKQSEKIKIQLKRRDLEASSLPQVTASETWPETLSLMYSDKNPSDSGSKISSPVSVTESETPLAENKRKAEIRRLERSSQPLRSVAVSKQKKHDNLDATWRAIDEGRSKPQLKKSNTWEATPVVGDEPKKPPSGRDLRKSDTFNDSASSAASSSSESSLSSSRRGGFELRREKSPSQDELNRRVEAFIKKFNDEIRLQGQESYNRY